MTLTERTNPSLLPPGLAARRRSHSIKSLNERLWGAVLRGDGREVRGLVHLGAQFFPDDLAYAIGYARTLHAWKDMVQLIVEHGGERVVGDPKPLEVALSNPGMLTSAHWGRVLHPLLNPSAFSHFQHTFKMPPLSYVIKKTFEGNFPKNAVPLIKLLMAKGVESYESAEDLAVIREGLALYEAEDLEGELPPPVATVRRARL